MNPTLGDLQKIFITLGASKILLKPLAENDNSKQQIYLGGGFGALNELPFGAITTHTDCKIPNFKAKVDFSWLSANGKFVPAPHAQLILYPSYPEVRLSGFLFGCAAGPSRWMQPIPRDQRKGKDILDGRVLFMAVTPAGKIYAYLAPPQSTASCEVLKRINSGKLAIAGDAGVLYFIPLTGIANTTGRDALLTQLLVIHSKHWIPGNRLQADGQVVPYRASNGGGYTLEAELGIRPNGNAAPDFQGWEVKASADARITLMTPEPDSGHYGTHGVESFIRKYGYERPDGTWYFTGLHRVGERQKKTRQLLTLKGFDPVTEKITDINGGIVLFDQDGSPSAGWTYPRLIEHWGRKHANAAYVPYQKNVDNQYWFHGPVLLGTGTSFDKFLSAMHIGEVFYDPAPKISPVMGSGGSRVKARSQFRTTKKSLPSLYDSFESIDL
ncbi:MAG: MvaI/BcnI family restriction endonuclease [Hydrogenophaga sp.]|nr:MvaI/BcnI family restriction endonuclease [Hydrogenophaga sp.]